MEAAGDFVSSWSSISVGLLVVIAVLVFVRHSRKSNLKLPPGPFCLPIVGYLPFLSKEPYKDFDKLSKKYGPVISLYLGSKHVIILGNFEVVKEAFSLSSTFYRPDGAFDLLPDSFGLLSMNGAQWAEQRRYCFRTLKNLGLEGTHWAQLLQDEVEAFVKFLDDQQGQPVVFGNALMYSMCNNIMSLACGVRFEVGHPNRELAVRFIETVVVVFAATQVNMVFPWLVPIMKRLGSRKFSEAVRTFKEFNDYVKEEIVKHKTMQSGDNKTFIDEYLKEISQKDGQNLQSSFTEKNLRGNIQVLLTAGSETTKTAVHWLLLAMAKYPEVQHRIHEELDRVIGSQGRADWSEKKRLPYTCAAILEGQRWRTLLCLNVPRMTSEDTKIAGYDIPKGTTLFANLWAVHNDPNYWKNPEEFNPERFLINDGLEVNFKAEGFVSFSYGKRSCPGEIVGIIETFAYFTSLLQRFRVLPPEGGDFDMEGTPSGVYQPPDVALRFVKRN